MSDPTTLGVYRRYVSAKRLVARTIGDLPQLMATFKERVIAYLCQYEEVARSDLPRLHSAADAVARGDDEVSRALSLELDRSADARRKIRDMMIGAWYPYRRDAGHNLCYALIQQLEMPPPVRKRVEAAAKFWTKSRIKAFRPKAQRDSFAGQAEVCDVYLRLCSELRKHLAVFEEAVSKGRSADDPDIAKIRRLNAGPFTVVNTGGFDDTTMTNAVAIVQAAAKAMQGIGLDKVCYGDVLISQRVDNSTSVSAFYLRGPDEMFVRAGTPESWDTVRIVCHELAHRFVARFIGGQKGKILALYKQLKARDYVDAFDESQWPKMGETIVDKGRTFKVVNTDFAHKSIILQPLVQEEVPPGARAEYRIPLAGWHKLRGTKFNTSFVTPYAATDAEENFCEMVSFYALGKLPEKYVSIIEEILR